MAWAPERETRAAIKFWLECLQVVTVVLGVITAAVTVFGYVSQREAAAKADADKLATVKRELRQPYEVKKLELYLEAARVVAHLAATPREEWGDQEARFWQLYWGELAFVESTKAAEGLKTADGSTGPEPSIESLMVDFCKHTFPGRCSTNDRFLVAQLVAAKSEDQIQSILSAQDMLAAAIKLARQASQEIRDDWEKIGR
jgi:hypothetical protein